ncbi:BppU family phage baseplate upper protein [Listeria aquatica]|uniref:BppU family phage baseplate upper protein n=1 Tax=Listeria aquatica TaxID=1494960 RepID=UPI003EF2DA82
MALVRPIPYRLDLNTAVRANPRIVGTVGDKDSLTLEVTLTVNSVPFDLTGWSVYFKALLPDDEHYVLDDSTIIDSDPTTGKFTYTFVQEAFSFPGTVYNAKFMLTKGSTPDQITHSFDFNYQVKADPIQGKMEASSFVSDYERFKEEIKEMMQDSLTNSAKALEDSQNAVELSAKAEAELAEIREEIAKSGYVSKTGDNMDGTLELDAQEALHVRYGAIKHFVGSGLANGTEITFSVGYESANHLPQDTLVYVVGEAPVGDTRFSITSYSGGYLYGYAPAEFIWSKSLVNGAARVGKTITPANAISVNRDGDKAAIKINNGYALTDEVYAVPDLNNALDFGKDYYVNASAQNAPVDLKTDTQGSLYSIRRSASSVIQMYMQYTGRVFTRYFLNNAPYVHSKTDANGWSELASISDAQAKADKALSDAKNYFDTSLAVQSVTLTPKNGFTASRPLTAAYVKMGDRYWVSVSGIVAKGTGAGTGICATVPTMLAPDTDWNKLFSGAQQSTAASNHANIYLSSGGDINIVAVGAADVNTGLDGISYFTKEVTV